ncbi:MAG: ATP synthase F0 subunit B [Planctomycetaceae bacterium]|nr:ATP synthase F0 subunit B [Planctomycetaceae bacterium]
MIKTIQENWIRWSFALLLVFGAASLPVMADDGEAKAETATSASADSDSDADQHDGHEGDDHDKGHQDGHDDHDGHDHDGHGHDGHGHDDGHGDAHGAHGHDATDLSHANGSHELSNPGSVATDMAVYTLIVFILMMVVLRFAAWNPIKKALEEREQGIIDHIADARRSAEKAERLLEEYEAKIAAAAQEANEIVAEGRRDAEATKDRIVKEAQQAATAERDRALNDIVIAKNAALQDVAEKSADIAVALAGKIVNKELNASDHQALIKETLDNIQEG